MGRSRLGPTAKHLSAIQLSGRARAACLIKYIALWKTKLAGEAGTYAKRLIDEGYDTVQGLAELDVEDLAMPVVDAGMRKGDAEPLMGRVSQKCTSSGGEGSSKNGECSVLTNGTRSSGETTDSVSMVEAYAIAASKTGAVSAVNRDAIKAAEPVPELKGKTTAIDVVAIIEWLKSISKHQIVKGTALGEVVLKMSKLFDWPAEEIVDKAWGLAREDKMQICWKPEGQGRHLGRSLGSDRRSRS